MKCIAKPIKWDSFQLKFTDQKFHQWLREKPVWFKRLYNDGKARITNNAKEKYVSIDRGHGELRPLEGHYILFAEPDMIMACSQDQYNLLFEVEND